MSTIRERVEGLIVRWRSLGKALHLRPTSRGMLCADELAAALAAEGQGDAKPMREQFEAWWLERHPGSQFNDLKRTSKSGAYDKGWLNDCWLAWNTARAFALRGIDGDRLREFADKLEAAILARDFTDGWNPFSVQQSCSEMVHEVLEDEMRVSAAAAPSLHKESRFVQQSPRATIATEGTDSVAGNSFHVGRHAGAEMHLAAAVFCPECRMLVEVGTDDCPHSAALHKEELPAAEKLQAICSTLREVMRLLSDSPARDLVFDALSKLRPIAIEERLVAEPPGSTMIIPDITVNPALHKETPDFGTAGEVIAGLDAIKKHNDALAVSAIRAGLHKEGAGGAPAERELKQVLSEHWLAGIHCHHAISPDDSTYDWATCACSKVNLPHRGTVGEAVGTWIEHVLDELAAASPAGRAEQEPKETK